MTDRVFIIDLPVHVVAENVDLAREHLARISDAGPVRLQLVDQPNEAVQVLYVNFPEDRGYDGQEPYTLDELQEAIRDDK